MDMHRPFGRVGFLIFTNLWHISNACKERTIIGRIYRQNLSVKGRAALSPYSIIFVIKVTVTY